MSETQNDHSWFREQIALALAGGLDSAERVRFDAHAAECEPCAAELRAMEEMEQRMTGLFAQPASGLEDRIVESLRTARERWRPIAYLHPAVRKAVAGVAAAIAIAAIGYAMDGQLEEPPRKVVASTQDSPRSDHLTSFYSLPDSDGKDSGKTSTYWDFESGVTLGAGVNRHNLWFADGDVDWDKNPFGGGRGGGGGGGSDHGAKMSLGSSGGRAAGEKSNVAVPKNLQQQGQQQTNWGEVLNGGTVAGAKPVESRGREVNGAADWNAHGSRAEAFGVYFKPTEFGLNVTKEAEAAAPTAGVQIKGGDGTLTITGANTYGTGAGDRSTKSVDGKPVEAGLELANAPAAPPPPAVQPAPVAAEPVKAADVSSRKIIRSGQMEFEVDRFDAAFAQVSKLTTEAGGYLGTTDSEKLPNGKVKGMVTLRVPPDRLDTLVLQLRGIGDLKSQKLDANDITKQYYDLESELKAARAMEERLLMIIKEGKGQIKDLLAAEKELGTWRTKIEKIVGEMRYFDNQVSLSTLVVSLFERDIRTPATAQQTETINTGLQATDVEKARADALKAIDDAKGRVIQSDLKQHDAGQFSATIVAEIPPDASGPLLDRLKQIGTMARLDVQRKQTNDAAASDSTAPLKVENKPTRLNLSLYNLANVAPRISSSATLAADDVEATYRAIIERVNKGGGRVVGSNLAKNKPEQTTGTITFEVPSADADAMLSELRAVGEMMNLTVNENPDVNNVTTAKRGFALTLVATASVPPRETATVQVAAVKVAEAREKILAAASGGGARVLTSQLNEGDRNNPSAALELEVPRSALAAVEKVVNESGDVVSRNVSRSSDSQNTLDTKVKLQISVLPAEKMPAREATGMTIETNDVDDAMGKLQLAVSQAGGRVLESNMAKERDGTTRGRLAFEVPLAKASALIDEAKKQGAVRGVQSSRNLQVPAGALAKARVELQLVTPDTLVEPGTGPFATIRAGLAKSVNALLWSLEKVIVGVCVVVPIGLVLWGVWKLASRSRRRLLTSPGTPGEAG